MRRNEKQRIDFLEVMPNRIDIDISYRAAVFSVLLVFMVSLSVIGVMYSLTIIKSNAIKEKNKLYATKQEESNQYDKETEEVRGRYVGRLPGDFNYVQGGFFPLLESIALNENYKTWLTEVYWGRGTGVIRINGFGVTPEAINRFVKNLSQTPELKDVKFQVFLIGRVDNADDKYVQASSSKGGSARRQIEVVTIGGELVRQTKVGGRVVKYEKVTGEVQQDDTKDTSKELDSASDSIFRKMIYDARNKYFNEQARAESGGAALYAFTLETDILKGRI